MKKYKLPKDALVEPEQDSGAPFIDDKDVEGHGLPTTAPPSLDPQSRTRHGGEAIPSTDDDEVGPTH
jgi:hypothetical protein